MDCEIVSKVVYKNAILDIVQMYPNAKEWWVIKLINV